MNILFVTYNVPYPLDAGGKIRAYHLLKSASTKHDITLLSYYRTKDQLDALSNVSSFCKKCIPIKRRNLASWRNIAYLPTLPFPAALYYDKQAVKVLRREMPKKTYDLIHLESFYTTALLKEDYKIPKVVGTENIEWKVYEGYADKQKNPFLKSILGIEISRIKRFEINTWKKADMCLAVSKADASAIALYADTPCRVVKNGVDIERFAGARKKKISKQQTLLFVGNFSYVQNQDAALFLLREIASKLPRVSKIMIVGRAATQEIIEAIKKTKETTGVEVVLRQDVSDIQDVYREADTMIAPLRIGSGTKFKVLEAMASKIPVIATTVAVEGIEGKDKTHYLLAKTPQDFSRYVELLSKKPNVGLALAHNARKLVEKSYNWEYIGKDLLEAYETVVNNHRKL